MDNPAVRVHCQPCASQSERTLTRGKERGKEMRFARQSFAPTRHSPINTLNIALTISKFSTMYSTLQYNTLFLYGMINCSIPSALLFENNFPIFSLRFECTGDHGCARGLGLGEQNVQDKSLQKFCYILSSGVARILVLGAFNLILFKIFLNI